MRKSQLVVMIILFSIISPQFMLPSQANTTNLSISSGGNQIINLGYVDEGMEIEIDYSVSDNIDTILMTSGQYSSWQSGNTAHTESGSDYDDDSDDYVFTTLSSDTYYILLDNSNTIGQASDSGNTVTGDVEVIISTPSSQHLKTRTWVDVNSFTELSIGAVQDGQIISTSVSCDIGFTSSDDLDFLYMDSIQTSTLQSSQWDWNKHFSFEDTCSYSWEYQTGKNSGWSLIVDNTDNARTNGLSDPISVDVEIKIRNLIPLIEIADTSRMIDDGDYYRIDLGYQLANSIIDIDYSFWSHGTALLTDDLDILVMESSEANKYENNNNADILGHASELDATSQSYSYQFPVAGSYSIIFDNTDQPSGGANDGSDIQVEIGVTSLTIPALFGNVWTSWSQSRHYADEGDHMALDLGNLNVGQDVYYYVDGKNIGGSIFTTEEYDILFMTKQNYDLYANGSTPTILTDGTKYKEDGLIPAIANISVPATDDYVLVFDAADGPNSNSADENADWIWEFMVLSDGNSMTNLQAIDNQYENSISVGTLNAPDSDSDGIRNGIDECPSTPAGASVDASGCSNSELDDDGDTISNAADQCPNTPTSESVDANGCSQSQLDDDGDGVVNSLDQCPNTPAGTNVDANGCEIITDSDGDGIEDSQDQCPNTPAGESVDASGCSQSQLDDDGDSIYNNADQCPNTPAGESVDASGCSQSQLDDDGDGVTNNLDQCPNTPAGTNVDANGCEIITDSDGDGVEDSQDQCPNTPTSESVDANGCSQSQLDDDGDGVVNSLDQCPNTPAGESVGANGCSQSQLDDDGDGVVNSLDQCPNTPTGATVDSNGCQIVTDSDGDGVEDSLDQCPNTPAGESVDSNGCSQSQLDDDGDGVVNSLDQCPNTPAGESVDANGCSQSQLDDDGDGVSNAEDSCENTPSGVNVDSTGCEIITEPDEDNDGVTDTADLCSNTPVNEPVNANGCSLTQLDSDGDGVSDNVDQCPNSENGATVSWNGCKVAVQENEDSSTEDDSSSIPGFAAVTALLSILFAIRIRREVGE